ncbi:non-ribosomal peptide synthetase [Roseibium marinum]|uniref:Non-ribosomal peptide synthase protein (TIGR01720 family)/amino acid adenylation domain-containing protein n=1 Tax=Roseibium marinum TaxID=281252 RepID=A0A2S3USD0_9HYPH|nr:non-ribosomal peptide synthetase [Roseibium marinum]POF30628.1 non-ribosomal peptide synthase protein (TIGR01720 family)/amino acid adenylation domain-containing protein [Roseibium marinum]
MTLSQTRIADAAEAGQYTARSYQGHRSFWQGCAAEVETPFQLSGIPGFASLGAGGGSHEVVLGSEADAVLARISKGAPLPQFVVITAAMSLALCTHLEDDHIVLRTPALASGEALPAGHETVPLVLPAMVTGTVREFLGAVNTRIAEAYRHQDWPVDTFLPNSAGLSSDVLLVDPANHVPLTPHTEAALLAEIVRGERITLRLSSPAGILPDFYLRALSDLTAHLLCQFADTGAALASLDLVSDRKTARAVVEGPAPAGTPEDTIASLFAEVVARHGQNAALITAEETVSYDALAARAGGVRARLRELGVQPGDVVGLFVDRTPDWIAGLIGIMAHGAVYLPLDPEQPETRTADILDQARPSQLLAAGTVPEAFSGRVLRINAITPVDCDLHADGPGPDDIAYLLFTSGSTGTPKGVKVAHHGFTVMIRDQIRRLENSPADTVAQIAAATFDASLSEIFMALLAGAKLALLPAETLRMPDQLRETFARHDVTVATFTPRLLETLNGAPLPTLRALLTAGDTAPPALIGRYARECTVFNAYGPTECSVCATMYKVEPGDEAIRVLPIGHPIAGNKVEVRDATGRPLPAGLPGEIVVSGPGVARGYLGRDAGEPPFGRNEETGERIYATGDYGIHDAGGALVYLGRRDGQIKLRGYRVERGEIEAALAAHPAVAQAHVPVPAEGGPLLAYAVRRDPVEVWPSIAEFFVYDTLAYGAMAGDTRRNLSYRAAMTRQVTGKVVLEIGPGAEAVLTRMCVEAGARKVYSVEIDPVTAEKARARIHAAGMRDRVEIITGDIMSVTLPEPADILVAEIVGSIGGSEAAAYLVNHAHGLMRTPQCQIPARSVTRLAGVDLAGLIERPGFAPVAAAYVERIFEQVGRPFDLRLCLKNLPHDRLLTSHDVLEDLDFRAPMALEDTHRIRLEVNACGRIDGLLAWLHLVVDADHPDEAVDILENPSSWLPVILPLEGPLEGLQVGDVLEGTVTRTVSANGRNPDFAIEGVCRRIDGTREHFSCAAPHAADGFLATSLHRTVFGSGSTVPVAPAAGPAELRDWLATRLPDYMLPAEVVPLDHLPLTPSGKVDTAALPRPAVQAYVAPRDALETAILSVWQIVLGANEIGVTSDFFAAGGDSISAIQIASRLGNEGIVTTATDILSESTVECLAQTVLRGNDASLADQGRVTGRMPALPAQKWFFSSFKDHRDHFNQAMRLRLQGRADRAAVETALAALAEHHDALRSRFDPAEPLPQIELADAVGSVPLAEVTPDDSDAGTALADLQESLNPGAGQMLAALLLRGPAADDLVICVHHAAVDWVSWGILIADFDRAYSAAASGKPIVFDAKTDPVNAWARDIEEAAPRLVKETGSFWRDMAARPARALTPADPGLYRDGESLAFTLPADLSLAVTGAANEAYSTRPQELILTALVHALDRVWSPGATMLLLEGHGREPALSPRNVSRTVGWFTTLYPVVLASAEGEADRRIKAVKETLRSVPDNGASYLPAALAADADPVFADLVPQVSFNFLGGGSGADEGAWSVVDAPAGPVVAGQHRRVCPLDIAVVAHGSEVALTLTWNGKAMEEAKIRRLAVEIEADLRRLCDHCQGLGRTELTASDVAMSGLSQDELEALLDE